MVLFVNEMYIIYGITSYSSLYHYYYTDLYRLCSACIRISSKCVNLMLHTENKLYTLPGSALTVCVMVVVVVFGWVLKVNLVIALARAHAGYNR